MVKSINSIRRIGSKQNDIKDFSNLLPLDVETVVEPFGGSFAVSKFFYKDNKKYKFHINDLDESLFYIYTHYQEYLQHLTTINDLYDTLDSYAVGHIAGVILILAEAQYQDSFVTDKEINVMAMFIKIINELY